MAEAKRPRRARLAKEPAPSIEPEKKAVRVSAGLFARVPRSVRIALAIAVLVDAVFWIFAPRERLSQHTPFNHFALMADAWLHGHLDLVNGAPDYTGNNDFAFFDEKVFVSFPPFPALLILPLVALSGSAEATRDGMFFVLSAGVAPAMLFLALDKLSRVGRSRRALGENVGLALLFAFATVYFSTSVQGSVWFAAHVVGAACAAGYLYASIDCDHPIWAGVFLGLGVATRTPLAFAFPLFACELIRSARLADLSPAPRWLGCAPRVLIRKGLLFLAPLSIIGAVLAAHNAARFGDPMEFGHRYLAIVWKARIEKWGLFSFHYFGRNLAIALASMPWLGQKSAPFVINAHGLALTVTSPFLAWAFFPRRSAREKTRFAFRALAVTSLCVALPSLLYQNSGWIQFGYRFSNDFSVFLIAMIAVSGRRFGFFFAALASFAVMVNGFGAATFQRAGFERYYMVERTQTVIFEPD